MNTEIDERTCLNYWWKYGDRGKPNRTLVVTNDQSETFLNNVQHNKFLDEELVAPRRTPFLEDHPCWLSETCYALHLQLPFVKEFVPSSATWGRAMPWRQRLIAQGKAEGTGERCLTAALSTMTLTMDWYWQSRSTGRKMSQYYFFHHRSHMNRPEIAIGPALWEPGDLQSWPSHGLVLMSGDVMEWIRPAADVD
jgi:hypothetical protein